VAESWLEIAGTALDKECCKKILLVKFEFDGSPFQEVRIGRRQDKWISLKLEGSNGPRYEQARSEFFSRSSHKWKQILSFGYGSGDEIVYVARVPMEPDPKEIKMRVGILNVSNRALLEAPVLTFYLPAPTESRSISNPLAK
jgi:hypothetical protein